MLIMGGFEVHTGACVCVCVRVCVLWACIAVPSVE